MGSRSRQICLTSLVYKARSGPFMPAGWLGSISKQKETKNIKRSAGLLCNSDFSLLRHCLPMQTRLAWHLMCRAGWPQTRDPTASVFPCSDHRHAHTKLHFWLFRFIPPLGRTFPWLRGMLTPKHCIRCSKLILD